MGTFTFSIKNFENLVSDELASQTFEIRGPSTLTYDQAKEIFEKQLSTGSLVGLAPGDSLDAAKQAAGGLAGALAQLGSNADEIVNQVNGKLPDLKKIQIESPVDLSTFVDTPILQEKIGSINPTQIQGLVSQAAATVNQSADQITVESGLGKYGLDAQRLQTAGLIKPGIADQIAVNPEKFVEILSSPTSWTGKLGADNLESILSSVKLQTRVQQESMLSNFEQLKQLGTITGKETANVLGPIIQNASTFGVGEVQKWLNGAAPGDIINQMNNVAKSANYSQAFAELNSQLAGGGSPLEAGIKTPEPAKNTVNRTTVNSAVKKLIGNSKIPLPISSDPQAGAATS